MQANGIRQGDMRTLEPGTYASCGIAPSSFCKPAMPAPVGVTTAVDPRGHAQHGREAGLVSSIKTKPTDKVAYRGERRIARLRKAVPSAANQIALSTANGYRHSVAMVTLTYRPGVEWAPDHVNDFQEAIRQFLKRQGIEYRAVWVLELTKKGQPHYHVLIWLPRALLKARKLPKPDDRGWWPHGSTRIEWARNAVGYLVKYTSKATHLDKPPFGARLFGIRGLRSTFRRAHRLHMLPFWLKAMAGPGTLCKRLPDGWWLAEDGALYQSPWELAGHAPDWSWVSFKLRGEAPAAPEGTR